MNTPDGPAPIDIALEQFKHAVIEFREYEGVDLSETDTRCKIIDRILHILGWREPLIRREEHDRPAGKYLDYKLTTTFPVYVIEAKKAWVHFEIPLGSQKRYRVGGAIDKTKNLKAAIEQARGYATNAGIQYCCVTNGFQFAFFRPSNNFGQPWERQMVTVFRNHTDIVSDFSLFYECLSFESVSLSRVSEAIVVSELAGHQTSRFQALAEIASTGNKTRDRNVLYPYTRELIKRVFQSLDNDEVSPDLLTNCYVESARDSSYERGIGELLRDQKTKIPGPVFRVQTLKRDAGEFQDHFQKLAESNPDFGSVTLILGTVGAGKTTFLNRFRKVFAKDLIDSSFVWVQIGFNAFVEGSDDLGKWTADKIRHSLEINYGAQHPFSWEALIRIYEKEIASLKEGVLKPLFKHDTNAFEIKIGDHIAALSQDSESHYIKCLDYFAKQSKRQVILVFDNADQHSPKLQNQVFLIAQKYAQMLRCVAFISLREESYWKNKEFGGLSAFHPTSFQIRAPRIDQVLAKRFKYASKLILENSQLVAGHFVSDQLSLSPDQIDQLFKILHNSLLGSDRRFIRFLEYTSPGEVRRALDFV